MLPNASWLAYYISYEDCESFLKQLNSKLSSQLTGSEQFRFPTEAQWEYAARGGNRSQGYLYAGSDDIGTVAWYTDNSNSTTHTVKGKQANELGLYDMSGNVWEWCYDWYDGSYYSNSWRILRKWTPDNRKVLTPHNDLLLPPL